MQYATRQGHTVHRRPGHWCPGQRLHGKSLSYAGSAAIDAKAVDLEERNSAAMMHTRSEALPTFEVRAGAVWHTANGVLEFASALEASPPSPVALRTPCSYEANSLAS